MPDIGRDLIAMKNGLMRRDVELHIADFSEIFTEHSDFIQQIISHMESFNIESVSANVTELLKGLWIPCLLVLAGTESRWGRFLILVLCNGVPSLVQ